MGVKQLLRVLLFLGGLLSAPACRESSLRPFAEPNGGPGGGEPPPLSFVNPILPAGISDPWVIRQGLSYYLAHAQGSEVRLIRADRLQDLGQGTAQVVYDNAADGANPYNGVLWAPELHSLSGQWYIYACGNGDGVNGHAGSALQLYVLHNDSPDPLTPFHFEAQLAPAQNLWNVDVSVFAHQGALYLVWSGFKAWEGAAVDQAPAQCLYIQRMLSPATLDPASPAVLLAEPTEAYERSQSPADGKIYPINSGPEALRAPDGTLHLIYYGAHSAGPDAKLLDLKLTGTDPLNASHWQKRGPVLVRDGDVTTGPGQCSFAKSPDGQEDWILYHAYDGVHWDQSELRSVRMQKFEWLGSDPDFGKPASAGVPLVVPSGS